MITISNSQYKQKNISFNKIIIIILFLLSGFGFILLEIKGMLYIKVLILLLIYFSTKVTKKTLQTRIINLYFLFIIFSCIYSGVFNQQNIFKTFFLSYDYYGILTFFLCYKYKISSNEIPKLVKIISIIFCCCYIIQWIIQPISLFSGSTDEVNINDDQFRMRMPGSICAYALYFLGINQFLLSKKKSYLLLSFLSFIPIIIMGFRSLTILLLFSTIIIIIFITKKVKSSLFFIAIGSIILILSANKISFINNKIQEMKERQEGNQTFSNDNYIRWIELAYYHEEVFTKPGEKFFGGGFPNNKNSNYVKKINDAIDNNLYWVDLGLIGLSYIIGIPTVLLFIYLIIRCIKNCRNPEDQYIRFTLLTVLLGSIITSMEIYRTGNMLIIGLFLYYEYITSQSPPKTASVVS